MSAVRAGYKQTEVGVIPEDWGIKSLGQISDPVRGGSPRPAGDPKFFNGTFIPWLTVAALTNIPESRLVVTETATCLTEEGSLRSRTLLPGTLIIANSGATLGVAKILGVRCCANDGIAALLNIDKNVSAEYLAHFINTRTVYLRDVVATGNGQPNLNTGLIGGFTVPLPATKEEQEAIAEALSDADALIESLEQLLAKKRHLKQGVMQELLTGKKRLPGFSGEWGVTQLGEVATFHKGKGLPKSELVPDGSERCIHYGELFTQYPEVIDEILSRTNSSKEVFRSIANDVLMPTSDVTPRGLAKASCVKKSGVILGGDILVIRTATERINGSFLSYVIRREEQQVLQLVTGSTVFHLYGSDMKKFRFSAPPVREQVAIVEALSDMDVEIATLETELAKTRALKQGMMQKLLTGEIRLL